MQQVSLKGDAQNCFEIIKNSNLDIKKIKKQDIDFVTQTSPQVQSLFHYGLQSGQALNKNEKYYYLQMLQQRANRIDQGGVLQTNDEQVEDHMQKLQQTIESEQSKVEGTVYTPGVDEISAQNICHKRVEELVSVRIKDLKKGQVNQGKILWLVSILPVLKMSSISILGQDENSQMIGVSLYNFVDDSYKIKDCQRLFPVNTRVGLKNPYLKCFNTGFIGLRVDHPVNLIKILPLEQNKLNNQGQDKIVQLKEQANQFFKEKEYYQAEILYSLALDMIKEKPNSELKIQVLNNRSFSLIKMRRYVQAFADALEVLKNDPSNQKAKFRKGEALIGLSKYKSALEIFELLQSEGLKEAGDKISSIKNIIQQQNGNYDIFSIPKDIYANFDNFTNYYGPLIINRTQSKGRGLFLTKDVVKDEILMVEKAFAFGMNIANNPLTHAINYETKKVNNQSQEQTVKQCVKRCIENKLDNSRLQTLYSGQDSAFELPDIQFFIQNDDSKIKTDILSLSTIRNIVLYNAFEGQDKSCCLYLVASFLNHSDLFKCNTQRAFQGQMIIVKALYDLKAGTEITHPYINPGEEKKLKSWGIQK